MTTPADSKLPISATARGIDQDNDLQITKEKNSQVPLTVDSSHHEATGWNDKSDDEKPEARTWRTSFLYFGPLSGVVAMLLAAASVVACLGILAGSDGQDVDGWVTPPSTYIAIFTAIANMSMRYAAIQGVFITWWRSASKGSTLSRLETSWRSGFMLRGAITAGRSMGLLGLACICSTVVVVDGPLIQRASGVVSVPNSAVVPLNVTMAPEIPHSATGGWVTIAESGNPDFEQIFNETIITANGTAPNLVAGLSSYQTFYHATYGWKTNAPLDGVISGCPGDCMATIKAPAVFPVECKTASLPVDYNIIYPKTSEDLAQRPPLESDSFVIDVRLLVEGQESINVFAAFATVENNATGLLRYRTCILRAGIGLYDVSIQNDQIIIAGVQNPLFFAFANNTQVDHTMSKEVGGHPSTLAGIVDAMTSEYDTWVTFYKTSPSPLEPFLVNSISQQFVLANSSRINSYSDPFDMLVQRLNQLMLYMGGAIGAHYDQDYYNTHYMDPGLSVHAVVDATLQGMVSVYHTNYYWFLGAALIELTCIAVVALTYWGWWKVGRPVSLSPLEVAKAFRSPLLAEYNSNSTGREMAAKAGEVSVRYGVIVDETSIDKKELGFGDPALVSQPVKGMRFDK